MTIGKIKIDMNMNICRKLTRVSKNIMVMFLCNAVTTRKVSLVSTLITGILQV